MTVFAFALLGTAGDVKPCLGVAAELQRRGHRVELMVNEHFERMVADRGLPVTVVSSSRSYLAAVQAPRHWARTGGLGWSLQHYLGDSIAPVFRRLQVLRDDGVVCVATRNAYGARFANEALGVPLFTTLYSPAFHTTAERLPYPHGRLKNWLPRRLLQAWVGLSDRQWIDRPTLPLLNAQRQALGLAPATTYARAHLGCMLAFYPDWFDDLRSEQLRGTALQGDFVLDAPPSSSGPRLPPAVQRFLADGARPAVFTFGTGVAHVLARYRLALEWSRQRRRRAIFLTPFRANLPAELADTVLVQDFVELGDLLPHCALLVHHGGIGTTAQALRAGVAQLVWPLAYDQPDNGYRVRMLGVGELCANEIRSVDALEQAINRATAITDLAALSAIQARMSRRDGAQVLADLLEAGTPGSHSPTTVSRLPQPVSSASSTPAH